MPRRRKKVSDEIRRMQPPAARTHEFENLVLWRKRLHRVGNPQLPAFTARPNPTLYGDRLISSIFSPGQILAFSKDGERLWRRPLDGFGSHAVLIAEEVIYAADSTTLFALDPQDGAILWTFSPQGTKGETVYSSPTYAEGRLFLGDRRGYFYALNARDGKVLWSVRATSGKDVNATAAIWNEFVITATNSSEAVAYHQETGSEVWRANISGPCVHELFLFEGNTVVITFPAVLLLSPASGEIMMQWSWNSYEIRSATLAKDRLFITMSRKVPIASREDADVPELEFQLAIVNEFEMHLTPYLYTTNLRWEPTTNVVYESRFEGLGILDPQTARRLHNIFSQNDLLQPSSPATTSGRLFFLCTNGKKAELVSLRHP